MSKKTGILVIVLAVLSLCLSAASMFMVTRTGGGSELPEMETSTQYVMYVGTNDKDTYVPKYSEEEAKEIVDGICLKHFDGYTLQEATGAWVDEKNNMTHEYTLVCYFDGVDEDTVYKVADDVIEALNQNTVLIEKNEIRMEYYSGGK